MQIEKYISELLYENNCIVIPGLGAFVTHYKPAQIADNQDTVYPPSKEIVFNKQLKTDDGLLSGYIASKEGTTSFDAMKRLEDFRENIQYRLEKGEKVTLEGLGSLEINDENQITFKVTSDINFLLDSYGLGTVSINPNKKAPEYTETVKPKGQKKKKGWMFFLLIPVAALAIFIYLNIANNNEMLPTENNEAEMPVTGIAEEPEQITTVVDSIQTDSVVVDTSAKPEIVPIQEQVAAKTEAVAPATEINYYLIGGSFSEQENADKYFAEIEKLGYKPIHLGKQGKFFTVAIGGYETYDDAKKIQNGFIERDPDSGVYIIRVKDNE